MDIKYSYYNTSKGYRVVGGTAAHFLKADGSLDGTSYIPVNTEINMGDKNLNFTSGSLSKFENSSRVFNKVFQNYTQSAQTGILSIKFPQASTAATMFDVTIKVYNYQSTYLGNIRVAFYKQTATVIHSTGRKCLIECTDNFPSTIVNVGMDLSGNVCINLGDINTVWNLHTNIEVERVSTVYTGAVADWSKGWSQILETVAPVVPTTYQSLVTIPVEIGATRSIALQNLSTNPTNAGTVDISGGGTSASLTSLTLASKSDGNVRSMRHELQSYYTSAGSVNYPSQIGAGIRLERYSSATDQRGFNLWSAGASGQIYFKTFSGSISESAWETIASREWANLNLATINHTHTFASITSKPTTLAGYGITDAMSTSHPANVITSTNIANWNTAFGWGNHALQDYATTAYVANNYIGNYADTISSADTVPNSSRTGVYRVDTNFSGVMYQYAPMLHLGGGDTMAQLQVNYGNGNENAGELSYRGGYLNSFGDWRTAWDNVNLPNPFNVTKNVVGLDTNTLQGTELYTSTDKWTNKPSWTNSGSGSLLNISTYYDVPEYGFQMYMDTETDSLGIRSRHGSATFSDWNRLATTTQLNDKVNKSGDTMTGALNITSNYVLGTWRSELQTSNYMQWMKYDGSKVIAYIGANGGAAVGDGGNGEDFVIANPTANIQLRTAGIASYNGSEIATKGFLTNNYALRDGSNATYAWNNLSLGLLNNPSAASGQFANASGDSNLLDATYGNGAGIINLPGSDAPTGDWYHRLKMLHGNSAGYYTEIAVQMTNANSMWYKRYEAGTTNGWIQVWDKDNLPDYRQYGLGTNSITVQNAPDLNNISNTSILGIIGSTLNKPFSYGSVWHHKKEDVEYTQMAIDVLDGHSYTRGFSSSLGDTGWKKNWNDSDFNNTDIGNWSNVYSNSLMSRGVSFVNNIDSNTLTQGTEIMSIELPNGTGNTNFPFDNYGTFMRMKSNSFTSDFAHEHNGSLWIRNWYNPAGASAKWRKLWDSVNLVNPATETWVNTNFIPKSHPVYNITQANINSWNAASGGSSHTHSNLNFLNNIDQWLGVGQAPSFSSVRLMNYLGYGQLALEEGYIGSEMGLVDLDNKVIYAGRENEYLKYGSSVNGFEALNVHFDAKLLSIGKEITNDEDKVQLAGNISVDTTNASGDSMQLILNPLYNTDGDVRDSRNAHIYIVTRGTVRLPNKPILGQRIEIFNYSKDDIEVMHDNVGTLFILQGFEKITGIVGGKGFIFDEKPVYAKQYDI